jgi:chromosome segregation ATPase
VNPWLFPPALLKRALEDLAAIGDAARRLPALEEAVLARVDAVQRELSATRAAIEPLSGQLDALRADVRPIQQLAEVRKGIEPLDEDMRSVREGIDELEPLVKRISARLTGIDAKLDDMRGDLSPLGDLAEKFPGVGRR